MPLPAAPSLMRFTPLLRASFGALVLALLPAACFGSDSPASAPPVVAAELSSIGDGWAQNSVNTTIFRKNSVVSNATHQYAAYYEPDGQVVLARRAIGSPDWTVRITEYTGNIADAHNSISIALDGKGTLHLAWDHHNTPLRYARSRAPGSLELTPPLEMVGTDEDTVSYPEFYATGGGDLLFFYRDGASGRGNLVINRFHTADGVWTRLQDALIDGEDQRNAYWQVHAEPDGQTIHLSWNWRETWDVSSNHDLCYAVSRDGGKTWQRSSGEPYALPITAATAEYAWRIPQNSELINQTSMCSDAEGRPYIATYWRPQGEKVPQFHLVYHDGSAWQASQITQRRTPFSLSGGGTKRIPISRPQILADSSGSATKAYLIFRDEERDNRASVAICPDLKHPAWKVHDLTDFSLGQWEPSYDIPLWHREKTLGLFIQKTAQGDGETTVDLPPQPVSILTWTPSCSTSEITLL